MDFKLVMKKLLAAFEREGIRYALMGGFALGFWGVHRATIDIDFLVDRDDLDKISLIWKSNYPGLETRRPDWLKSSGYGQ